MRYLSAAVILFLCIAVGSALAAETSSIPRPLNDGSMTHTNDVCVVLQNYVGVSDATLSSTKQEITSIFGDLGINLVWNLPHSNDCQERPDSLNIVFNLEPKQMGARLGLADDVVGAALPCTTAARTCYGYLLYDNLRTLFGPKISESRLLAFVAAHEIGHLLLGGDHSMDGVMAGLWNDDILLRARAGTLLFSPEEGMRIRARLHAVKQTGSGSHAG